MKFLIFVNKFGRNDDLLGFFVGWTGELLRQAEMITIVTQETGDFDPAKNLRVISLDKSNNTGKIKRFLMYNWFLYKFRKDYDFLLVMMAPGWLIASFLMSKLLGKRIYLWYAVWRGNWKLKLAEKMADKIFCSVKKAFPFETSKLVLLGQGVDTDYFISDKTKRHKNKILLLGRISPIKRIEVLFKALDELKHINANFFESINLEIVGDTTSTNDKEYLAALKKLAEELNLDKKIKWVGRISHQETVFFYQNTDLYINLTPTGSFDKTILEAMSCEDLILASNLALRDFMDIKLQSLTIFKENDSEDLAKKIYDILNIDDSTETSIRSQLREIVIKHHSQKQWAQNLIKNLI
jgi:glycosyltransferase involved in cell wall biosynthesis